MRAIINRLLKRRRFSLTLYEQCYVREVDGSYAASIREFDGCFAVGDTLAQAARNLERTAHEWVEACKEDGIPIPPPAVLSD